MSDLNVALIIEAIDKATAPGLSPRMRGNRVTAFGADQKSLLQTARHGKRIYQRAPRGREEDK